MSYIFTSESVSAGHPDKVCDQISDAILDAYLSADPESRVACETMIKNNLVFVAGEITSTAKPNIEEVASLMVKGFGGVVTELTQDQAEYINVPQEGPFKDETYKY
jgi:S-adenosylmethionine synthetase